MPKKRKAGTPTNIHTRAAKTVREGHPETGRPSNVCDLFDSNLGGTLRKIARKFQIELKPGRRPKRLA